MSSRSRAAVAADLTAAPGASVVARTAVLLAAAATGIGTSLALRAGEEGDPSAAAAAAEILGVAIGWSFIASGLVAWTRRPENRTGPLLVVVGFLWFIGRLDFAADPTLETIGAWVRPLHIAVFAHLLLAFPSGRLESRLALGLAAAAYVNVGLLNNAPNLLADTAVAAALFDASQLGTAVIFVAIIGALVHRWQTGTPAWRRTVAPLLWPGALALSTLILFFVNEVFGQPLGTTPGWLFRLAYLTLPLLFLAGLLRTRLARASVAQLVVELGETEPGGTLRDALARALGDPTLQLAYWLPDEQRYVDLEGRPLGLPRPEERRAATLVERDGARVAALLHDEALADDPDLLRAVSATAALALENERLQAELRARLEDLRASRARIVDAADQERKRIERNLHDGTQQRLTSIALGLGIVESKVAQDPQAALDDLRRARQTLAPPLTELRDLSQGNPPRHPHRAWNRRRARGPRLRIAHPGRRHRRAEGTPAREGRGSRLFPRR